MRRFLVRSWNAAVVVACAGLLQGQYVINTVAGGGPPNPSPATSIPISATSLSTDPSGNVLVGAGIQRVFRISPAGQASIVAGNGTGNYRGDGGSALNAGFVSVNAVVQDASGNLYISDYVAAVVRKVDSNGVITRFAGGGGPGDIGDNGPASSAVLLGPTALALDGSFLYIADTYDNRIRRVNLATGVITTFAGTGESGISPDGTVATQAKLNGPMGICVANGFLYIADTSNNRVLSVLLQPIGDSARIFNNAGAANGTAGFSGDGGLPANARLNAPSSLAADSSGMIYVADAANNRIRRYQPGVMITTIAGNGTAGFSGDAGAATLAALNRPKGIAVDTNNIVFIADTANNRIRKVSNGVITTVAGNGTYAYSGDGGPAVAATLSPLITVGADAMGNLYIVDTYSDVVRQVNPSGVIATIAGTYGPGFAGDGGPATQAKFQQLSSVAVDSKGVIYIADYTGQRVRRIANGIITTFAGTGVAGYNGDNIQASAALLNSPLSLVVDSGDNLYIADVGNHRVRRVSSASNVITTVAGNGMQGDSGDDGPAGNAMLNFPGGIAFDSTGRLFIADGSAHRVRVVAGGTIRAFAGTGMAGYSGDGGPAAKATLQSPSSVALDGSGNVFIADVNDQRIRRVDTNLVITTVAGDGASGFSGDGGPSTAAEISTPENLASGPAGTIYVADVGNNRVRALTLCTYALNPTSAAVGSAAGSGSFTVTAPGGCAWNAASTANWIAITQGSGSGNGTVNFNYTSNPGPGQRSATIMVADKAYSLTQAPPSPALSISKTHAGNFTRSQQNATYTVTVSNIIGAGATSGTVTVSETVPPGLSLVSMTGVGWSCNGSTCTRADVLAAGSSYPAITVTVNVSANASSPQVNQVTASGGGSANANALDSTVVDPLKPQISNGGVVNNAGYMFGSTASSVAPGSIAAIFGSNLTDGSSCLPPTCSPTFGANGRLNTTMAGAQVTVGGTPVPIFYATPTQLGVQIPFETPGTSAQVVATVGGVSSPSVTANLTPVAPGIFTFTADGQGAGAITHVDGSAVTTQNPAHPAELVILYATGLGAVGPGVATGALPGGASTTLSPVTLTIGGIDVIPDFAGLSGCCVGLNQINARVPAGVNRGDAVTVVLKTGGKSSNVATIAVQ